MHISLKSFLKNKIVIGFAMLIGFALNATTTKAQMYLQAEFAPGFGGYTTSPYFPGLAPSVQAYTTIGFTIAENYRFITGLGYSSFYYETGDRYNGYTYTETLGYVEVPLLFRAEIVPRKRRKSGPIKYGSREDRKYERQHSPFHAQAYVDMGVLVGVLANAKMGYIGNYSTYQSWNVKPALGLGGMFGSSHKFCYTMGMMLSTAVIDQNITGKVQDVINGKVEQYSQTIPLTAFSVHFGVRMRLGNKKV